MKSNDTKTYKTMASLAVALDRNPGRLTRWRQSGGWPIPMHGPWTQEHVETLRAWAAQLQENRAAPAGGSDPGDIGRQYKIEQTALTRIKRELLESKYIDREIHERAVVGVVECFVRSLDSLAARLPSMLEGDREPGEVEAILVREFDAERKRLADQSEIELAQAETAAKRKRKSPGRKKAGAR